MGCKDGHKNTGGNSRSIYCESATPLQPIDTCERGGCFCGCEIGGNMAQLCGPFDIGGTVMLELCSIAIEWAVVGNFQPDSPTAMTASVRFDTFSALSIAVT